ncbi:cell division ATP-binding protein FtsE [Salmonella enterica subsp. arizonae]|uniref:Cell division ATP-binding protein FtsE n=1 Tax=Salmonella enterica subsp. arizonae TaxID=59203 RepID=A0A379SQL8_SALER|nr:cell division ATP-binding protein FtsE [Salmonella enterica subsp. arizonae]
MQPGEMAFLTGHSGAGKSTLLKLICGIERPSAGKIFFSGHDITRLKNREVPFLRRQIGMIFQDHHLLMDRTVYDNVAIPLIIAGASGDDIRRRVSAALDKVGCWTKRETSRFNSPGANNSAWALPARWSISLRYCWRMNRPGTWMTRCRKEFYVYLKSLTA